MIYLSSSSHVSFLFYGLAIICLTFATFSASYGGNETDYRALLSFKSKITHDPYKVLMSWNHSFHFCDWSGISCGKRHKRVTALRLSSQGLEGSLSPHVGNLSFLQMFNSNFSGMLTIDFSKLRDINTIRLDNNKLNGRGEVEDMRFIDSLKNCSRLEDLGLMNCNLMEVLPISIGNDFKALVYEFMSNGSVHDWLHSSATTSKLNLLQRINILIDVASALDYLHNHCQTTIVHGDLKPSNILLDADMVAHVGDFGLARLLGTDLNQNSSTGVKGTVGYAPPEYGLGSEMTSIGDVYSYGILLLEVMTGKNPTDDMFNEALSLYKFAYMALQDHVIDVIDDDAIILQSTEANAKKVEECMAATIKIGVSCSVDSPPQRMKIEIVVTKLKRIANVIQDI
nr:leucine-rich repeat protein [Tanacetum cinerariifolium]